MNYLKNQIVKDIKINNWKTTIIFKSGCKLVTLATTNGGQSQYFVDSNNNIINL